ncbi:MAG: zinc ribbon domain-containing protein [Gammaproteobacteria bacterium]|nr:zinc ribbon domain-containing protein [Gammaproteobacteria bacterium]
MICLKCGKENDNLQTVCSNCGEPLSVEFFSCPVCGKVLKRNDKVCPRCHTNIYEREETLSKKKVITTPKFVAKAPFSLPINIFLTIGSVTFLVSYLVLYYGSLTRTAFNIVGLSISLFFSLLALLTRLFLNKNADTEKLEKRIGFLKSITCVAAVSSVYVFLFVVFPSYFLFKDNGTYFNVYFIIYIVFLALALLLLPIFMTKTKIRTR